MKNLKKIIVLVLILATVVCGLVACNGEKEYTLIFKNGEEQVAKVTITGAFKLSDLPTNPTKDGYIFVGWFSADGLEIEQAIAKLADGETELTISAKWKLDTSVEVTFMNDTTEYKKLIFDGVLGDLPTAPTKEEYIFQGWFTAEDVALETAFASLPQGTRSLKVFAKWKLDTSVEVTFMNDTTEYKKLKFDGVLGDLPTAPTKDRYIFKGWFTAEDVALETAFASLPQETRRLKVFAKWQINALDNTSLSNNCADVFYQSNVVLTVANLSTNSNFSYTYSWSKSLDNVTFENVIGATSSLDLGKFVAEVDSVHYFRVSVIVTDKDGQTQTKELSCNFTVKPILATVKSEVSKVYDSEALAVNSFETGVTGLRLGDKVTGNITTVGGEAKDYNFKGSVLPANLFVATIKVVDADGVDITKYYVINFDLLYKITEYKLAKEVAEFDFVSNSAVSVDKTAILSQLMPVGTNLEGWTIAITDVLSKASFDTVERGSTYYVNLSAEKGAFKISKNIIVKYKSVMVADASLMTIEDALKNSSSGTIIVKFNTAFAEKNVAEVCYADALYYKVQTGVILLVPYDGTYSAGVEDCETGAVAQALYVELTLPKDMKLTVLGTLTVNAKKGYAQPYGGVVNGGYGQMVLNANSELVVENEGALNCNGYIIGDGKVIGNVGSTIYDTVVIQGFRGGTASSYLNGQKIMPFDEFTFQNIETPLVVFAGANYLARGYVYIRMNVKITITIVGENGGLFNMQDGYIQKSYNLTTGKTTIDFFGNAQINTIKLSVGVTVNTLNEDFPIPGNFILNCHGNVNLASGVYLKIMPGAEFNINVGSVLTISSGARLSVYGEKELLPQECAADRIFVYGNRFDYFRIAPTNRIAYDCNSKATIKVLGKLNVEQGAQCSGNIETSGDGAQINTSETTQTVIRELLRTVDNKNSVRETTITLKGTVAGSIVPLAPNAVYNAVGGQWVAEGKQVAFNLGNGQPNQTLDQVYGAKYNLPTTPTKEGFMFRGWSRANPAGSGLDEFSEFVTAESIVDRFTTALYAVFTKDTATITFDTVGGETMQPVQKGCGLNADLNKENIPLFVHNDFEAWYLDRDFTKPFDSTKEVIGDFTVFAKWTKQLRIAYYEENDTASKELYLERRVLPNLYTNGYISVWFLGKDAKSDCFTSTSEKLTDGMTLYAYKFYQFTVEKTYTQLTKAIVDSDVEAKTAKSIIISGGYNSVSNDAFRKNVTVERIVFDSITSISSVSVTAAYNLTANDMPANSASGTFNGCNNLTTVVFNKNIYAPGFAFWGCPSLDTVIAKGSINCHKTYGYTGTDSQNRGDYLVALGFGGIFQSKTYSPIVSDTLIPLIGATPIINANLKIYMDFEGLTDAYKKYAGPYYTAGIIIQTKF